MKNDSYWGLIDLEIQRMIKTVASRSKTAIKNDDINAHLPGMTRYVKECVIENLERLGGTFPKENTTA